MTEKIGQQIMNGNNNNSNNVLSLAIIGKDNEPLYIREFFHNENNINNKNNDDDDDDDVNNHDNNEENENYDFPEEELFGLPPPSSSSSSSNDNNNSSNKKNNKYENKGSEPIMCSLRQQFILHAALDRFEQLAGPPPGYGWRSQQNVYGADAMWVGLLCPVEDMRVYGYMTTTQIKFLLTVEDDCSYNITTSDQRIVDQNINRLFVKLHRLYVDYTLNPFSPINAPITSKQFDDKIKTCVSNSG